MSHSQLSKYSHLAPSKIFPMLAFPPWKLAEQAPQQKRKGKQKNPQTTVTATTAKTTIATMMFTRS